MAITKFGLAGGFSAAQLRQIRDGALRVLDEVGMAAAHPRLCEMLSSVAGLRVGCGRVRFSRDVCERYLDLSRREQQALPVCNTLRLEGPWYPGHILDASADQPRPGTREDLRKLVRLCCALGVTRPVAPLAPRDVPPEIEAVTAWKIALESGQGVGGGPLASVDDFDCVLDMAQAVGRGGPIWCTEVTISPLTINPRAMDLVLAYLDRHCLMQGEPGPMLSAGCTGPVFAPAFFVQGVAEWLGAYIILKAISDDRLGSAPQFCTLFNGGLRFEPMHFDMRSGCVAFGTPESLLFRMAARQIFRHLGGRPELGGSMRTCSKQLDAQNIAQRSMNLLAEALDGVRCFVGGGMLANDDAVSPELLVIDLQLIRCVERVVRGLDYADDIEESLAAIRDVGPGGSYLAHASTAKLHRKVYGSPELFDYRTLSQWRSTPPKPLVERAQAQVADALAGEAFRLDPHVQAQLDRVYAAYVGAKGLG